MTTYWIWPSGMKLTDLDAAKNAARLDSISEKHARVEDAETEDVLARFEDGEEVEI